MKQRKNERERKEKGKKAKEKERKKKERKDRNAPYLSVTNKLFMLSAVKQNVFKLSVYIQSTLKIFRLSVFRFDLLDKSRIVIQFLSDIL